MKAFLIVNLGTPEAPTPEKVGPYLSEFLMDPEVIDIPLVSRWLLVKGIIVPTRKRKSAKAYKTVWTKEGSPLAVISQQLTSSLKTQLGEQTHVGLSMRYGQPNMLKTLKPWVEKGLSELKVFPLYPQYATSTTKSVQQELQRTLTELNYQGEVQWAPSYYNHPAFVQSFATNLKDSLMKFDADHVLMSFHGIPERHLTKQSEGCLKAGCCDTPSERSSTCYRYQCFRGARLIAEATGLSEDRWSVSFQSRIGSKWLKPFTDIRYKELADHGVKRLLVCAPSFTTDCLETLEEVAIRGREDFIAAGGHDLKLVPSLNASETWVQAVKAIYHDPSVWVHF